MYFSLVFHNHQPVGQLPWAFDDAWREAYQPFLETLREFPAIKVGLHYSGPLLDWMAQEKPETIALVRRLVEQGQVEVLCGGYYEPIFAVWPREDSLQQIALYRARVGELFDFDARGLWLTERVWEPQLAHPFVEAGVTYTLLDSTLFEDSGIPESQSCGVFEIEHSSFQNAKLRAFPINRTLRQIIPWHQPLDTVEYLRRVHHDCGDEAHVLFGDDGEKFGAWPGTFEWVYECGWMRNFFQALQNEAHWLEMITPGEYARQFPARQTVHLDAGSYPEMQEWSGGDWRNFLDRYHESRDMHREVLRTREAALHDAAAYRHILRAQSNDAYWHGVFGGLYLKHLRQAVYAECAQARVLSPREEFVIVDEGDELIVDCGRLHVAVRAQGGHLFGLTSNSARHNLLATLRRYREPYHEAGTPEDWFPRGALLDHFLGEGTTLEQFQETRFKEEGDFISEDWNLSEQQVGDTATLTLQRDGGVWHDGVLAPLTIEKKVKLKKASSELQVEYLIANRGELPLDLWWGIEWNAVLSGSQLPERHYHAVNQKTKLSLEEAAQFAPLTNPIVADNWLGLWLEWEFPEPVAMWHAPIETVSQKEGGHIERIYQQSAFLFHRRLQLSRGESFRTSFVARITNRD